MRKQYFTWIIAVFGIIGTVYGAYSLAYNSSHGKGLSVAGLFLLIFGAIALAFFCGWAVSVYIANKKRAKRTSVPEEKPSEKMEEKEVVAAPETKETPAPSPETTSEEKKEPEPEPEPETKKVAFSYEDTPRRSYGSSSSYSYSTSYVKRIGYGPILRVEGSRIVDMRSNTYYRIEGNSVMQDGYGIRYEIRGNQIRDAFGGYLYEINGSNINKVFGGFYASISGNYITLYDLSEKYEMTDSLSKKQLLVVSALLFGN